MPGFTAGEPALPLSLECTLPQAGGQAGVGQLQPVPGWSAKSGGRPGRAAEEQRSARPKEKARGLALRKVAEGRVELRVGTALPT